MAPYDLREVVDNLILKCTAPLRKEERLLVGLGELAAGERHLGRQRCVLCGPLAGTNVAEANRADTLIWFTVVELNVWFSASCADICGWVL